MKFDIIVAINDDNLIGVAENGEYSLPWNLPSDLKFFRNLTTRHDLIHSYNVIIMGHNTWISLPETYRKSRDRFNIVISRDTSLINKADLVSVATSFTNALNQASQLEATHVFVIGGATIYREALMNRCLRTIYLTHVKICGLIPESEDDSSLSYIKFPISIKLLDSWSTVSSFMKQYVSSTHIDPSTLIEYEIKIFNVRQPAFVNQCCIEINSNSRIVLEPIQIYTSKNHGEIQYQNLIRRIMNTGVQRTTRNGMTKGVFGAQLVYDLSEGYPLCTLKRSYPKMIFEELMWMIRGQTNVGILRALKVNIWNANSSSEFLKARGLPYEEGDIGPGYGFQMRHYGATYINCKTNYHGQGIDQLAQTVHLIKNDPISRRNIISLWNPNDLDKMALPPCHMIYQFSVCNGRLDCQLYQRSWDVALGWNTSTAALFTYILANHCDLQPGHLVHSIGDAHIYQSHIDSGGITKMCDRMPMKPPLLIFDKHRECIEDYVFEDLSILDYHSHPPISFEMSA